MKWQSDTWPQRLPQSMNHLRMTGEGNNQIDANGVLRLKVSDKYINLIDKTQALFDWFLHERSEPWLVKCDDDVWLSPTALSNILSNQHHYAGAYGQNYAGGPLYILHRNAIAKLGRLRSFVVKNQIAEDMAVGAAAAAANIRLGSLGLNHIEWYKHKHHELTGPHNWDMAFCFTRGNHQALMEYCEKCYQPT